MGFSNLASSAFLVISFLLAHLPLHSSQPLPRKYQKNSNCSLSFNCSSFGEVGFPFANSTSPECGFSTLNCTKDNTKVQLQKGGRWFDIKGLDYAKSTIKILDPDFQNNLESNRCDLLNNFTAQGSFLYFEPIGLILTFLKCKRDGSLTSHSKFFQTFGNFTGCKDYDLFFYSDDDLRKNIPFDPETLPNSCSVVQLPVYRKLDPNLPIEKLEFLFPAEFSLKWTIRQECHDCHYFQGGRCADNNGSFECEDSENAKERKKGSYVTVKIAIIGAVSIVGTFIIALVIIFCCFRRKYSLLFWKKKTKNGQNIEAFLKNHGPLALERYTYSDIKKMTNFFKKKLGQGGFGGVFKGKLLDGRVVAVKVLSETKGNGEEFINEVASISRTSHVNIVTLFGFCVEGSKRALVYEFMPNGSLEKFIYDEKSVHAHPHLGWETIYKIAIGIARGLEYLHRGCKTRILHFDIKPHNILLDEEFSPKISDFGLAKLCLVKESIISMIGARGTPGYIAPELFSRNFGGVSHKSDVYSYGMMVLEMVGRRKNIDAGVSNTSEIYFPHWIYNHLNLCGDLGLHDITTVEEKEITWKMIIVGLWCIQIDPSNRPSMSRVLEMLGGSLEALQIPPKPFLSSPPREQEEDSSTR